MRSALHPTALMPALLAAQVVDRPTQGHRFLSRAYVQPQWVVDSANFRVLAEAGRYAPGAQLPPHLSPFAGDGPDGEDHVPDYQLELQRLQARAAHSPSLAPKHMRADERSGRLQWKIDRQCVACRVRPRQRGSELRVHQTRPFFENKRRQQRARRHRRQARDSPHPLALARRPIWRSCRRSCRCAPRCPVSRGLDALGPLQPEWSGDDAAACGRHSG